VKQQVMSKIPAGGLIALSTDGWKKKAAEQGVPLIKVNIFLPGGGSIFHKVVTTGGVVKNAQWIFYQHVARAEEVTGGKPELPIGGLMDNTKANRKAEGMLEEHEPRWLAIGCQAHGLSQLIKHLADPKKTTAPAKVLRTAKMMSNVVEDSKSIRSLVHQDKPKAIGSHCPTRFGTPIFILWDVLACKDASRAAVSSEEWESASAHCTHGKEFPRGCCQAQHLILEEC
jgi:hypothetical protein